MTNLINSAEMAPILKNIGEKKLQLIAYIEREAQKNTCMIRRTFYLFVLTILPWNLLFIAGYY
jgi:hypothetical protein